MFGKTELETSYKIAKMYIMLSYVDSDHPDFEAGTGHIFYNLMQLLTTAFGRIEGGTANFSATDLNEEMALMNIGKLARKKLTGPTLLATIDAFLTHLRKKADGTSCGTTAAIEKTMKQFYFVVGGDFKEYIGEWNTTTYRTEDDALAGFFICLNWLVTWFDVHCTSLHSVIRDIAEYTKDGSVVRGTYRQFSRYDERTWGSALMSDENGVDSFLDMTTSMVDDVVLRGIDIPVVEGFTKVLKLFTKSKWTWMFGRTVEVVPLWFIWNSATALAHTGMAIADFDVMRPFTDNDTLDCTTFIDALNNLIARIKSFYFKNKSFVKFKDMYKTVKFFDLPVYGVGAGGLLTHQMSTWEEVIAGTNKLCNTAHTMQVYGGGSIVDHNVLQLRRGTDHNNVFQVIGDVPLDDYLLWCALSTTRTYDGNLTWVPMLSPMSTIVFGETKTEDEPYQLIATSLVEGWSDDDFDDHAIWLKEWNQSGETVYLADLQHNKAYYYEQRAADPYKKLEHTVYDINHFDFENLIKIILEVFYSIGGSTAAATVTEIPVSGIVDDMADKKDDKWKKPEDALAPAVSAIVKEDKKEDKKDGK